MTQKEFKDLFEMYFSKVRNYIYYRAGNTDVANDIAQETFLKIWEKRNSIRNDNLQGLIYKIAGDLFISHYRKQKRTFDFFEQFTWKETGESPEDVMAFNELKQLYNKALNTMNEKQRTVFLMSRVENLKYNEMATALNLSVKAIEKRMNGALQHLARFLK